MRIFLDANILFSACNKHSATQRLVAVIIQHTDTITSSYAIHEAQRNLQLKRPEWLPELPSLLVGLRRVDSGFLPTQVTLEEKDRPILGDAIAAKCTHLLTSDKKHFGHLYGQTLQGVRPVSLTMLADELMLKGHLANAG